MKIKYNNQPIVSILISAYNHSLYIEECIKSIWEQDYKNIEILVIDDNSEDNTLQLLKNLQKNSPLPMYIWKNNTNQGISRNLNKLIYKAKGKYISFMSSDDKYFGIDTITTSIESLEKDNNLKVIYNEGYVWDGKNFIGEAQGKKEINFIKENKYNELLQYMLTNIPHLLIQGSFFRTDFLKEIGGFDENLKADDWVLNIKIFNRAIEKNYKIKYSNHIAFLYRQHTNNTIKRREYLLNLILEVIDKYSPDNYKKIFKSEVYWGHGLFLLKKGDLLNAVKFLFKSQKLNPNIKRITKTFQKFINLERLKKYLYTLYKR